MLKQFKIGFIFIIAIIFSININAKVYEHKVPDELTIIFTDYKKHLSAIFEASNKKHKNILDKFKKSQKIHGSYIGDDGKKQIFKGRARITGDWKDHIDSKNGFSSLSISLKKGNIGGVVKFRLLLPHTKKGHLEILWSTIIEEIGYPVPLRKIVKVDLMGREKMFIFEEKPEKEFLESHGFRESTIIEFDEREIWKNLLLKPTNKKKYYSKFSQYKIKNSDFLKNPVAYEIAYRAIFPDFETNESLRKFDSINRKFAEHGLNRHNRKFIYDVIYNQYIPIYFDGGVHIPKDICENIDNKINNEIKRRIEIIKTKFENRTYKKKFSKLNECLSKYVLGYFDNSSVNIKSIAPLKKLHFEFRDYLNKFYLDKDIYSRAPVISFDPLNFIAEKCFFNDKEYKWSDCIQIKSQKEIKKIFTGDDDYFEINGYSYVPLLSVNVKKPVIEKFYNLENSNINKEISVRKDEIAYIKLNIKNSSININLYDNSSYVVLYDSYLNNSKINVKTLHSRKNNSEIRYSKKLLTGCLTIIDSEIISSKLISNKCMNEDGINFVRVEGSDVKLKILDTYSDAFDADFSNIYFQDIYIKNAGNDCVDVSSGTYNFNNMSLTNCGDKAVSIGENSLSSINNIKIDNAKIGVASKDFSTVFINKFKKSNLDICLSAYQKKQEYGYSKIFINNNLPSSCSTYNDKSIISRKNYCENFTRNYFYSSCNNDKQLSINVENNLPKGSKFYFADNKKQIFALKSEISSCNKNNQCTDQLINIPENAKYFILKNINKNIVFFEKKLK